MRTYGPFVDDAEVAAIGRGLFDRSLPKARWTHAAHLAAALWVLRCRPEDDAYAVLADAIRAYNLATGVANTATAGYHATITQASVRAIRAFAADAPSRGLAATANALATSPFGDPAWLHAYWSRDRLFSTAARAAWLDPDLAPWPFP